MRWSASAAKCAATATIDFPEPVGVARITLLELNSSIAASSWCGDSVRPCCSTQAVNASYTASAPGRLGRTSTRLIAPAYGGGSVGHAVAQVHHGRGERARLEQLEAHAPVERREVRD